MKRQLISYLLAVGTAAASLIACTREPETAPEVYDQETEYEVVLTASLAPDTRGVTVTSDAVTATWSADDKVALVYNNKILTALEVTGISGNTAQLSGKVYGAYPTNTAMTLYYGGVNADFTGISYDYSGQDGTAASAAARAYLQASVKIAKQENKKLTLGDATTGGAITLAHQQAYYELKFQYGPEVLKVRSVEVTGSTGIVKTRALTENGFVGANYADNADDHFTVTTTADEGLSTVYFVFSDVATPPTSDGFLYDFKITDVNGTPYTAEWKLDENNVAVHLELDKRGPAVNGTYRSGTWVLDRQTPTPTAPQAQAFVYDGQPHELVTAGAISNGTGTDDGPVMMYYVVKSGKPVDPVNPVLLASDTTGLTPGNNADWSKEVPVATDPGHYCVWYKVVGGRYFKDIPPTPVNEIDPDHDPNTLNAALIDKRRLDVTAPTGIANLKYTGSAQALVNAGTIKDKTSEEFDPGVVMQYCVFEGENPPPTLNNATWITEVPQAVNAGKYHIWYKVDSTAHYHGLAPADLPITVTIQKVDAVIANPVPIEGLVYNGALQQIALPADASDGCTVYYYVTNSATVVPTEGDPDWVPATPGVGPKEKNAGTYYIWTKVVDESGGGQGGNYTGITGVSSAPVVASIAKAPITVTVPECITDWTVYDGQEHTLLQDSPTTAVTYAGVVNTDALSAAKEGPNQAKLYYRVNSEGWVLYDPTNPNLPKRTDAGNYQVSYKVEGGNNFESKSATTIGTVNVAQATPPVPTPVSALKYTGSAQSLMTAPSSLPTGCAVTYIETGLDVDDVPSGTWSGDIPAEANAGWYRVWYTVTESTDGNYKEVIDHRDVQIKSLDRTEIEYEAPTGIGDLVYNGSSQALVDQGTITAPSAGASFWYYVGDSAPELFNQLNPNVWSKVIPTGTDAGTYKIWTKIDDTDYANSNIDAFYVPGGEAATTAIEVTIAKAAAQASAPDLSEATITSTSITCSTITISMEYSTDGGTHWTAVVTAGEITGLSSGDTVWIRVKNDDPNYADNPYSKITTLFPTDTINGKFTIDADGHKVFFSNGNLTRDSGKWAFLSNSWEYNTSAATDNKTNTTDGAQHFDWGTVFKSANSGESAVVDDIVADLGSGWRGLSRAEWRYLLGFDDGVLADNYKRAVQWHYYAKITGASVGTGDKRYLLIFPDLFEEMDWDATTMGDKPTSFDGAGESSRAYTEDNFTAMQSAGIVILPAVGYYTGSWSYVGSSGPYWSSTSNSDSEAAYLFFSDYNVRSTLSNYKASFFLPVRLVQGVPTP